MQVKTTDDLSVRVASDAITYQIARRAGCYIQLSEAWHDLPNAPILTGVTKRGYPLKCCSYGHHSTRWGREMLQRAVTIPSWPANVQLRLKTLDFVLGLHQLIHQPPIFLLSLFAEPSCIAPDHGSPYCFVPSGDFAQSTPVHIWEICINVWILRSWLRDT